MKNKRIGRFSVYAELPLSDFSLHSFSLFMSECIIIKAEYMAATQTFEFIAISDFFDIINSGQQIPVYSCIYENGKVIFVRS